MFFRLVPGKHQDAGWHRAVHELADRAQTVHLRHRQPHHREVRLQGNRQAHRVAPVVHGGDDFDAAVAQQQGAHPFAHDRVIVGDQHAVLHALVARQHVGNLLLGGSEHGYGVRQGIIAERLWYERDDEERARHCAHPENHTCPDHYTPPSCFGDSLVPFTPGR